MEDMIADFITETLESLDSLDQQLVQLEENPSEMDILNNIFRTIHTIKGTCGFVKMVRLEKISHKTENLLDKMRHNEIIPSSENITIILKSIDRIKLIIDKIQQTSNEPEGNDDDIINIINAVVDKELQKQENSPDIVDNIKNIIQTEAAQNIIEDATKLDIPEISLNNALKENIDDRHDKVVKTTNTIKVSVEVIESLMQSISELVLTRNQLLQIIRNHKDNIFAIPLERLNHLTSDLQDKVMKTRMQPIGSAWVQFPRMIRDLAVELNKKVVLKMIGNDTELDRQLIESIKDPLTHMVRNAIDHGIEKPEDRIKVGKPEQGVICLKSYHQGGHIIIEVSDDGRGLSIEKIKQKALANHIATEEQLNSITDQHLYQFIFKPGFSTAEHITEVSGRGVGMDVVKNNIEKINGTIEMHSIPNQGSKFSIKIPLTLAIMPVLIAGCKNGIKFGIPQISVLEIVKTMDGSETLMENINDKKVLRLRNKLLPLITIEAILYPEHNIEYPDTEPSYVVVCEVGSQTFGLVVHQIYDTEEIVVKPVSPILKQLDIYSGSTLLGDGSVIMILDPNSISKYINKNSNSETQLIQNDIEPNIKVNRTATFLIFQINDDTYKAVPLDLVSRLDEIPANKIEKSLNHYVCQYRGSLMYLAKLDEHFIMDTKFQQVIVFTERGRYFGFMVKRIIDIVETSIETMIETTHKGYIGSLIINGNTVDIIDTYTQFSIHYSEYRVDDRKILDEEKTKSILFIDDSAFFRKFIPQSLRAENYNVEAVFTPKVALTLLETKKFDLIITDMHMPEMNGVQFTQTCKSNSAFRNIPIIMLSSNVPPEVKENYESYGINAILAKTDYKGLINIIHKTIG